MTPQRPVWVIRERIPYVALTLVLLLLDRWSKVLIHNGFALGETRPVIEGFFDLTYLRNTGIAFGLFADATNASLRVVAFSAFAAVAAVVAIVYSIRSSAGERLLQVSLALVLAGALGNLYDRITIGYVIDFLYFHLGAWYWPAFNVADAAISTGVGLMAFETLRHELRDWAR